MSGVIGGHGGAREGSGRKGPDDPSTPALQSYNEARAAHEWLKVADAELALSIKRGEYLPRAPIQLAAATAVAAVVQALRSLPDALEREFKLPPDVVEAVEKRIDETLADLGAQFKAMSGE